LHDLQATVRFLKLLDQQSILRAEIKEAEAALDQLAHDKYPKLTEAEIQTLVVDDKWLASLAAAVQGELDRVSQILTSRICLLADRYAAPLPQIVDEVTALAVRVDGHLKKMEVCEAISQLLPVMGNTAVR
jgi:type I restriction enzyme M protein